MGGDLVARLDRTLARHLDDQRHHVTADESTVFTGLVRIGDRSVTVSAEFDDRFPLSLPVFRLHPWDALGFIPHVTPQGVICYLSPEGLLLDSEQPERIAEEAFERTMEVLAQGASGANRWDFVDEFEYYWACQPGLPGVQLISVPQGDLATLDMAVDRDNQVWLARTAHTFRRFSPHHDTGETVVTNVGLFLPLREGTFWKPPRPDQPFWTAAEIRERVTPNLTDVAGGNLSLALRRLKRQRDQYLVVSLPRPDPNGGGSLIGIRYSGVGPIHPLLEGGSAEDIQPVVIRRLDGEFLGRRGGATTTSGVRVMVVGCGAVGSRVAAELARSGVSRLTLVDPETLEPENTFRHVLGRTYWHRHKALGLKYALESDLPFCSVDVVTKSVELAYREKRTFFSNHDLVIFATGNPTIELEMNGVLAALPKPPRIIYTWLEPLGIGGHALLVQPDHRGCFRCLYQPSERDGALYNQAAFAAEGQSFSRAISGCGTQFTPFGSNDVATTAAMAVRLALDALRGRESGNPLRSWRGDSTDFLAAGFKLSRRYGMSNQELADARYDYQVAGCQVCGDDCSGDGSSGGPDGV